MTTYVYSSTDVGAPQISVWASATAAYDAVFYACLVTGYGSKVGAGFTRPYSEGGSNSTTRVSYKSPSGNREWWISLGYYGQNQYGNAGGYPSATSHTLFSTMSSATSGSDPVPGSSTSSNCQNSLPNYTDRQDWVLITNGRTVHFWYNNSNAANGTGGYLLTMGEFNSYKSGDQYNIINSYLCYGNATASSLTNNSAGNGPNKMTPYANATIGTDHYVMRSYGQTAGATAVNYIADGSKTNLSSTVAMGSQGLAYPNVVDGSMYMSPIWIVESGPYIRGDVPGLYMPCHAKPLGHLDTFSGQGALAGKTFLVLNLYSAGQCFIETSNTW